MNKLDEIALRVAKKHRAPQGHIQMSATEFVAEVRSLLADPELLAELSKDVEPVAWRFVDDEEPGYICYQSKLPTQQTRPIEMTQDALDFVKGIKFTGIGIAITLLSPILIFLLLGKWAEFIYSEWK